MSFVTAQLIISQNYPPSILQIAQQINLLLDLWSIYYKVSRFPKLQIFQNIANNLYLSASELLKRLT